MAAQVSNLRLGILAFRDSINLDAVSALASYANVNCDGLGLAAPFPAKSSGV